VVVEILSTGLFEDPRPHSCLLDDRSETRTEFLETLSDS
jgi:hypothetical protein